MNWVVPTLLWAAIMIRLITFHVYSAWLMSPVYFIWEEAAGRVLSLIPRRFQHPVGSIVVGAAIIIVAMVSPEFEDNTRVNRALSLVGYGFCICLLWATSRNRKMVDWHTVIVGILMQFLIALFILRTNAGYDVFSWISRTCRQLLGYANVGLAFLTDSTVPTLPWLAMSVVPPIIFFAGLAQILSYWYVSSSTPNLVSITHKQ